MKKSTIKDVGEALRKLGVNPDRDVYLKDLVAKQYGTIRNARNNGWGWDAIANVITEAGDEISASTLQHYMGLESARRREAKGAASVTQISKPKAKAKVKAVKAVVVPEEDEGPPPAFKPPSFVSPEIDPLSEDIA